MLHDVVDSVAHGPDALSVVVGDLQLELFLKRHDQFDQVERIGVEVVLEAGTFDHFGFLDAQLLGDDRSQLIQDRLSFRSRPHVCHLLAPPRYRFRRATRRDRGPVRSITSPSTPLTKRLDVSPPNSLASSTASLITTF